MDACRGGWVGVALEGTRTAAYVSAAVDGLVAAAMADGPVDVVAIDMPIGLPDRGPRQADVLARKAIGRLRSSVFMTPVRQALEAADHQLASARNRELAGTGISVQAYGLKPKLLDVDRWVRRAPVRVVEAHPEVSFAELAGGPLDVSKRTWAGVELRRGLLADAGIALDADLGAAGRAAGVDDVLDAAAAAWTARRVARGVAVARPHMPEVFSDGWPAAIWT